MAEQMEKESSKVYVSKSSYPKKRLVYALVAVGIIVVLGVGYILVSRLTDTNSKTSTQKVLTTTDLENPNVKLDSTTSDASVGNLEKELKVKIDKQIAAKENPFDTVNQLAVVLANTTNKTRPNQMADFVEDFLAKHEDTLSYASESGHPDQAQINYWKAELYAKLVYNYQSVMQDKFTGSDGKPLDTTKKQLKYVNLYLTLANDPVSHPPISEEDKGIIVGYVYQDASDFLVLKNSLTGGSTGGAQ